MSLNFFFLILDELSEKRTLSFTEQPWLVKTLRAEFKAPSALLCPSQAHGFLSVICFARTRRCDLQVCYGPPGCAGGCCCDFKMLEDSVRKGSSLFGFKTQMCVHTNTHEHRTHMSIVIV